MTEPDIACSPHAAPVDLYLDLLKRCVMNTIYQDRAKRVAVLTPRAEKLARSNRAWARWLVKVCGPIRMRNMRADPFDATARDEGRDWPSAAHTMIGGRRLDNIRWCVEEVLRRGVPGDLMETGVWRGGAVIFMRGILKAWQVADRRIWAADSFTGLPRPQDRKYPADAGSKWHTYDEFAVSLEEVQENFRRYGLLDDRVQFLKGWFRDTLPAAPVKQLAVLRLDGDMYESTRDALVHLYPKLSAGGFLIVDDYHAVEACRTAVDEYRAQHGIGDPLQAIDWGSAYWQKTISDVARQRI
jgi:hypothetical protein